MDKDISTDQKTWQVYNFEKRNTLLIHIKKFFILYIYDTLRDNRVTLVSQKWDQEQVAGWLLQ